MKKIIQTNTAPQAIGPYSQAVQINQTVYLSGQIPLDPHSMELVGEDFRKQATQVFKNMQAVCEAAGGSLADIVKLTIFLIDLKAFPIVNEVMETFFKAPYPARSTFQVSALPKNASVEIESIMVLSD